MSLQVRGGILVDADGNQLIDFGSGIAVTTVGNGNRRIIDAVSKQIADFTHTCFMVNPYEEYVAVCEKLNELTPGDHPKRSALFNSGAEAVENAVKVARHYTGKDGIVAFDHAYHGRTNLTLAMTAKNMPYKHRFGPFASELYRVDGLPVPLAGRSAALRRRGLQLHHRPDPRPDRRGEHRGRHHRADPGRGRLHRPAAGFLPALAQWCRDHDILFIADEVQSGFCRSGDWFACDDEGVVPDLMTTAKGIAGGMPLAAVTGRADIMDTIHPGGLGGTYGGNPVARAAAWQASRRWSRRTCAAGPGRSRPSSGPAGAARGHLPPGRRDPRPRCDGRHGLVTDRETKEPAPAPPRRSTRPATPAAWSPLTCGTLGNVFRFPAAAVDRRHPPRRGPGHPRGGLRRVRLTVRRPPAASRQAPASAAGPPCMRGPAAGQRSFSGRSTGRFAVTVSPEDSPRSRRRTHGPAYSTSQ